VLSTLVNPEGGSATVSFEWGPTTSYGDTSPSQVVTGSASRAVSYQVTGLAPGTTEHYLVVVKVPGLTLGSPDATFTTLRAPGQGPQLTALAVPGARFPDSVTSIACTTQGPCLETGEVGAPELAFTTPAFASWLTSAGSSPISTSALSRVELQAASCPISKHCVVVGQAPGGSGLFAARLVGETWAKLAVPAPTGTKSDALDGLVCSTATSCWAVGIVDAGTPQGAPLIEQLTGNTWHVVPSPNPGDGSGLNGIACSAASGCWAVGMARGFSNGRPLLVHLVAGAAHQAEVVAPGTTGGLTTIGCSSVTCFAPASLSSGRGTAMLSLRGGALRLSALPSAGTDPSYNGGFGSISCQEVACWLVGGGVNWGTSADAEYFDGSAWHVATVQVPANRSTTLTAVACTSATCFAVGQFSSTTKGATPLGSFIDVALSR
jgi:hypothetical protein